MKVIIVIPILFLLTINVHADEKIDRSWCTQPQYFPKYKQMISDLNNQLTCQHLGPEACKLVIGVAGVGALYGAAKGVQVFQDGQAQARIMCKASSAELDNENFIGRPFWLNFLGRFILPLAVGKTDLCDTPKNIQQKIEQTAIQGAAHYEREWTTAGQQVQKAESALRANQLAIQSELSSLIKSKGDSIAEASRLEMLDRLNAIQAHFRTERNETRNHCKGS